MAVTEIKNPYPPNQEGKYMSWENGFHSSKESDCPYDPEDSDNRALRKIWLDGFKANAAHAVLDATSKTIHNVILTDSNIVPDETLLQNYSTALLEKELKKRKLTEYQNLIHEETKLTQQLNEVQTKIQKLEILLGD